MGNRARHVRIIGIGVAWLLALPLVAFFAFVGWMKATAPISELTRHGAWTVHLPEWLGRVVGVSEMTCAILLLAGLALTRLTRVGQLAAMILLINQLIAGAVHWWAGEASALPQNAALAGIFAVIAWALHVARASHMEGEKK